jgi:hypothetical protein
MLLAIGSFMAALAEAGCGHPTDYPIVGLDLLLSIESAGAHHAPVPKPCTGPQCSNKSAPPFAPAFKGFHRAELWGLVGEPALLGDRSDPPYDRTGTWT